MKHCLREIIPVFTTILLLTSAIVADVPNLINYQGRVMDHSEEPVSDGLHQFIFKLYDQESGGALLFGETSNVTTENGYFNYMIGSVNNLPDDLFFQNDSVFLQITIDGEVIVPRFLLIASPYAIQAASVEAPLKLESNDTTVIGRHGNGTFGYLGGEQYGVYGEVGTYGNFGYLGGAGYSVYGEHASGNYARIAGPNEALYAQHYNGNTGRLCGVYEGVYGEHKDGNWGLLGNSTCGVYGEDTSGSYGKLGSDSTGVIGYGYDCGGLFGTLDSASYAVVLNGWLNDPYNFDGGGAFVFSNSLGMRVQVVPEGDDTRGIFIFMEDPPIPPAESYGLLVLGSGGWAGYFSGDVRVTGTIDNSKSGIILDHPLNPENQYLYHSSVNSPEMKNVYDGVVTLDESGSAVVILPDYFEAFNTDFRYQLTCIESFAPVYISKRINNNQFEISGGKPGMEISWQVTGIRTDPYAKSNPSPVVINKSEKERGLYLHSEAYGLPFEKDIEFEKYQEAEKEERIQMNR